jgi:hypothetical protein
MEGSDRCLIPDTVPEFARRVRGKYVLRASMFTRDLSDTKQKLPTVSMTIMEARNVFTE